MKQEIKITVHLGEDRMPERIEWSAEDMSTVHEAKAMVISFFDGSSRDTMRLDLWTRDLQVMEMDRFIFHTLRSLTETYRKATNNDMLVGEMHQFADHFGKRTGILSEADNK